MRVTMTGATGRIGTRLVARCGARRRGDRPLARPRQGGARARRRGRRAGGRWPSPPRRRRSRAATPSCTWPARTSASAGTRTIKRRLSRSRELGTRNLVPGLRAAEPRPGVLVSASAVGYYGPHGDERLDEDAPAGDDFLAQVCVAWEREAAAAEELGLRVVRLRTGVVLDRERRRAGQDAPVLPARRRRAGRRRAPVHPLDPRRRPRRASTSRRSTAGRTGPAPSTRPRPSRSPTRSSPALGRALHRPGLRAGAGLRRARCSTARWPTSSSPASGRSRRAQALGFRFGHPELDEALRGALG